jgi:hypothetical protein
VTEAPNIGRRSGVATHRRSERDQASREARPARERRRPCRARTPPLRPQTYATQDLQNQADGVTEVDKYIEVQMRAAVAAEHGDSGSEADAGDDLAVWSREFERTEAVGQTSRIA